MDKELRILILEDNSADAELEEYELRNSGLAFTLKIVDTREAFLKELDEFSPDLILSDYDLPSFDGLAALRIAKEKCPDVPFILVTGKLGEEFAIENLKKGATDYVLKGNLKRLVPSVERALQEANLMTDRKRAIEELRKELEFNQNILMTAQAIILVLDLNGCIVRFNPYMEEVSGYLLDEVKGKEWFSTFLPKRDQDKIRKLFHKSISDIKTKGNVNSIITKDRREIDIEWYDTTIKDAYGQVTGLLSIGQDITKRKRAEERIRLNEDRLKSLYKLSRMKPATEKEIIDFALEEAVRLTGSKIGYLHFVHEDQINLELFTWSKEVFKKCTAAKKGIYPLEKAGVWVDCIRMGKPVIHNDYQNLPDKKGYPEGHIHVIRHMSVPVFDGDKIIAVAGVGNKEEGLYDDSDLRQLDLFVNEMWKILKQKRAENDSSGRHTIER